MASAKDRPKSVSPYLVLAVTCFGIFTAGLDQMSVVTALPDMMVDIRLPVTELDQAAWIVIAYLLGYTVAMPLMGRVSDVYGHARVYNFCYVVFLTGSVIVATSENLPWMVTGRVIQAVGGGAVVPVTMAIVGETFPKHRRAIALGIVGAASELGGVLGPLYGGVITQEWGWQWVFWSDIPVGLPVIFLVYLTVSNRRLRVPVDYRGGLILGLSLACLVLALSLALGPWLSGYTIGLLLGCVFFFVLFLRYELGIRQPMVDLSMFKTGIFSAANLAQFLVGGALIIAMVSIPLVTDTIMGKEPLEGGLRLMRLTAMMPVGAVAGGFLCQRLGYRFPMMLGLSLAAFGFYLLTDWPLDVADPRMTRDLVITGLGFGLVIAPIGTAVINSVSLGQKATAAALVSVMRMVGMMVGLSALTSWGMGRYEVLAGRVPELKQLSAATLRLFHEFFWVAFVICLVALIPALWMRQQCGGHESSEEHP